MFITEKKLDLNRLLTQRKELGGQQDGCGQEEVQFIPAVGALKL